MEKQLDDGEHIEQGAARRSRSRAAPCRGSRTVPESGDTIRISSPKQKRWVNDPLVILATLLPGRGREGGLTQRGHSWYAAVLDDQQWHDTEAAVLRASCAAGRGDWAACGQIRPGRFLRARPRFGVHQSSGRTMRRTLSSHIESTPDVASGRARIAGTRIRVQDIVAWFELGRSPDEIASAYPHITLADVHAALAYYYDHREEIHRQIAGDDEFAERFRSEYLGRSSGKDADASPLSP